MTARISSRELMIVAIALAALLDFSANWLAVLSYWHAVCSLWFSQGRRGDAVS
jgi:hypothetical protein